MKSALILAALLSFLPAKVEPWNRVKLTGFIESQESFELFGSTPKRLMLRERGQWIEYDHDLAFASQQDYEQAERCIGQLVEIEAVLVQRGSSCYLVPVVLREKRK